MSLHDWKKAKAVTQDVFTWECSNCGVVRQGIYAPPSHIKILRIGEAEWDDRWLSCGDYIASKVLGS